MKYEEIVDVIKGLAKLEGFYGRLLASIESLSDSDKLKFSSVLETMKDWQPSKPPVVVPEITQKQAYTLNAYKNGSNSLLEYLRAEVKTKDYNRFARAWLDGYTVAKEQLYILKHIDLSKQCNSASVYLAHGQNTRLQHEKFLDGTDMSEVEQCHFKQSEINELNTGSYEQIEVEME